MSDIPQTSEIMVYQFLTGFSCRRPGEGSPLACNAHLGTIAIARNNGNCGSGRWNYYGTLNSNGGTVYIPLTSSAMILDGGAQADWNAAAWECKNDYYDPSGTSGGPTGSSACFQNPNAGTFTYSGNVNIVTGSSG